MAKRRSSSGDIAGSANQRLNQATIGLDYGQLFAPSDLVATVHHETNHLLRGMSGVTDNILEFGAQATNFDSGRVMADALEEIGAMTDDMRALERVGLSPELMRGYYDETVNEFLQAFRTADTPNDIQVLTLDSVKKLDNQFLPILVPDGNGNFVERAIDPSAWDF